MPAKDIETRRATSRAWYSRNRESEIKRQAAKRRVLLSVIQLSKIGRICIDCKRLFPPECLDFHHKEGEEKKFEIGNAVLRISSVKTLREEIAKCEIVCANCHRIRSKKARTWNSIS